MAVAFSLHAGGLTLDRYVGFRLCLLGPGGFERLVMYLASLGLLAMASSVYSEKARSRN